MNTCENLIACCGLVQFVNRRAGPFREGVVSLPEG